jgi:ornithine cyclodeaminase
VEFYDAGRTAELLPYEALADAIAATLVDAARGLATAPERIHHPLAGGGTLLVMPAADERVAVNKLVSVCPGNPGRGLPLLLGSMTVLDAATGRCLGVLDGPTVTARRTAALSLLAARTLAPRPEGALLVVGAGVQARAHLEAMREGLGTRRVFVFSRTPAHAEALAAHARGLGMEAAAVADPGPALERCALVVTATGSRTPVLHGPLRRDAFVAAVGAFKADMAEVAPEVVRACRVVVDTVAGCAAEGGDLLLAGLDPARDCTPLAEALGAPRPLEGPVLFKSVGHALFDLAAGRLALGHAAGR